MTSASRRQFNQLALAALGGAVTGSVLGCSRGEMAKPVESKAADGTDKPAASETAKTYDENLLLVATAPSAVGSISARIRGRPT